MEGDDDDKSLNKNIVYLSLPTKNKQVKSGA
jgi:hypothetical protein